MENHGSDLLERGGSTFSLESFDGGVPERRAQRSGPVGSIQSFASAVRQPLAGVLNSKARSLTWAGAELGMLAFFANAIMVGDVESLLIEALSAHFFLLPVSLLLWSLSLHSNSCCHDEALNVDRKPWACAVAQCQP